jgi:hypothetical protein
MLVNADVFIGVSVPGAVTRAGIKSMAADSIVFTLANPRPEIDPEEIEDLAGVIATGRSDYPNQINNVLVFPASSEVRLMCGQAQSPKTWSLPPPCARRSHLAGPAFRGLHHPQCLRP